MSDLVERLNNAHIPEHEDDEYLDSLMREAVTEIEHLQARNELLEKVVEHAEHLLAGGDKEAVHHLEKALAALKT